LFWEKFRGEHLKNQALTLSSSLYLWKWLRYYLDFCHKYSHRFKDRSTIQYVEQKMESQSASGKGPMLADNWDKV